VVERRSSLSNSVKTIIPSLILIRNYLDKNYRSYSQVIEFNNEFLLSEFEQPDYQDLYENHSHQKSNDKLVVTLISPLSQRRKVQKRRKARQNRALCFSDFKYNSQST
jgi:hypothetical protein